MQNRLFLFSLCFALSGFLLGDAAAPELAPLQSTMTSFLVEQDAEGKERLTEISQVKPGQLIEYALVYSNISDRDLTEVSIIGPIPPNTQYLADSAQPSKDAIPEFSIDNAVTFQPEPVKYKVRLPDGSEEEKIATADMYTQIRWKLSIMNAGEKLTLKYRVQVR
jgi:uncharacterized repeat protein (TIGR01451 family)